MREGKKLTFFAGVLALALAGSVAADDGLYYKEQDGAIVFTNVAETGLRPVPGFAPRHRIVATRPLPVTSHDGYIRRLSDEVGVSPDLIKAVAMVESGFDPHARSAKGALGLMQLMPATARLYGVDDAFDPWENLRGGATHLRTLLDRYDGDLSLTLAAYNAGAGAVQRYRGVPPYRETREYVRKVRDLLEGRSSGRTSAPPPARRTAAPSPVRVVRAADGTLSLVN